MGFLYVLPFIFYALTALFLINMPSGSGEQFFMTAINLVACVLTTILAVARLCQRGIR